MIGRREFVDTTGCACPFGDTGVDRRSRKTRAQLTSALVRLVQERGWEEISVHDICTVADVARSTFYLHFEGKPALLDFAFRHLGDELRNAPRDRELDRDGKFGALPAILRMMGADDHAALFRGNGKSHSILLMRDRVRRVIETLMDEELRASTRYNSLSALDLAFIASGVFGVIEALHQGRVSGTVADILDAIDSIIARTLRLS